MKSFLSADCSLLLADWRGWMARDFGEARSSPMSGLPKAKSSLVSIFRDGLAKPERPLDFLVF